MIQVQGQPALHSKFPTIKQCGKEAGEGQHVSKADTGGNGVEGVGGLDLDGFLPTPTRSFRFFLVAGIEANIPVTYGIGSQRKNQSTGCQFIGQSPVHSILAAADSLSVSGLRTAMSLLGWLWLLFLRGYQPPPQITAAPLEPVGTSTWSCCYRRWEPLWSGPAAGTSFLVRSWEEPHSCPSTHAPLGSRFTLILLRLLIIHPRSTPGTP